MTPTGSALTFYAAVICIAAAIASKTLSASTGCDEAGVFQMRGAEEVSSWAAPVLNAAAVVGDEASSPPRESRRAIRAKEKSCEDRVDASAEVLDQSLSKQGFAVPFLSAPSKKAKKLSSSWESIMQEWKKLP